MNSNRRYAGRGLCAEPLARLLCEEGPDCIREMDARGIGWAREDGRIVQAQAPGHDRPRCVYVDFLNTGPAVSKTLRTVVNRTTGIHKAGDLAVVDLIVADGEVIGAAALHLVTGAATGMAFVFNAPRFISCMGPLIAGTLIVSLGGYGKAATIIGLFYVLGLIAAPFLPETRGQPLPEAEALAREGEHLPQTV